MDERRQPAVRRRLRGRCGQAMIEYVIVSAVLLSTVAACSLLLYALRQQSSRVLELVASDYP